MSQYQSAFQTQKNITEYQSAQIKDSSKQAEKKKLKESKVSMIQHKMNRKSGKDITQNTRARSTREKKNEMYTTQKIQPKLGALCHYPH